MRPPIQSQALTTTEFFLPAVLRAGGYATAALFLGDSVLGALGWPVARPAFAAGLRYSLNRLARHCEQLVER